jgi:hypothetical protein
MRSRVIRAPSRTLQRYMRGLAAIGVVVAGAGLYTLGAQPFAVGLFPAPWDKLAHTSVFALIALATGVASGTTGWRRTLWCVAGAVVLGMLDEWHQAYLPGREAGWDDLAADALGGLLGAAMLYALSRLAARSPRHR